MKTYYIIKAYAANNRTKEERYHYFGKNNKVLGYIKENDVQRYTKDDILNHGYKSFPKAKEAAQILREMEVSSGWTVVVTLISEVA